MRPFRAGFKHLAVFLFNWRMWAQGKREGALSHLHLWIPHSLQYWPWASRGSVTHPHADVLLWNVQLLTALQWAANTYPALKDSGLREEFWIWALALLRGGWMLLLPILSNSTVVPGLNPTSLTSLTIQESSQKAPVPSDCPPPLPLLSTWPVPLHPLGLLNISSSGTSLDELALAASHIILCLPFPSSAYTTYKVI